MRAQVHVPGGPKVAPRAPLGMTPPDQTESQKEEGTGERKEGGKRGRREMRTWGCRGSRLLWRERGFCAFDLVCAPLGADSPGCTGYGMDQIFRGFACLALWWWWFS